jgi:hypothetical protein
MNPFKWYRYWRIQRLERKIAYLTEFIRFQSDPETNKIPFHVSEYHGIPDKIAKIKEYERTIYHLKEF